MILSLELLCRIAIHLSPSDLQAFAHTSKAFQRASDPVRFRRISITSVAHAISAYNALAVSPRRRNLVRELEVDIVIGRGKGKEAVVEDAQSALAHVDGRAPVSLPSGVRGPTLSHFLPLLLARTPALTTLTIISDDDHLDLDAILPSVATRVLVSLKLDTPRHLTTLRTFLASQPRLAYLSLPNQLEPVEPEAESSPPLSTVVPLAASRSRSPGSGSYCVKGDNRAKRLRLSNPLPSPSTTVPPTLRSSTSPSLNYLPNLRTAHAPASFILSLPHSCPLQSVTLSDKDLPRALRRRLLEKLAQHGGISLGGGVSRLSLSLSASEPSNTSSDVLGLFHEITRNLRDLQVLEVSTGFKDAYFKVLVSANRRVGSTLR